MWPVFSSEYNRPYRYCILCKAFWWYIGNLLLLEILYVQNVPLVNQYLSTKEKSLNFLQYLKSHTRLKKTVYTIANWTLVPSKLRHWHINYNAFFFKGLAIGYFTHRDWNNTTQSEKQVSLPSFDHLKITKEHKCWPPSITSKFYFLVINI